MTDDADTWVRFSEVGINARMRNALELFALRKEVSCGPGATPAASLAICERWSIPSCGPCVLSNDRDSACLLSTPPQELVKELPAALTRDWGADGAAAGLSPQGEHAD